MSVRPILYVITIYIHAPTRVSVRKLDIKIAYGFPGSLFQYSRIVLYVRIGMYGHVRTHLYIYTMSTYIQAYGHVLLYKFLNIDRHNCSISLYHLSSTEKG